MRCWSGATPSWCLAPTLFLFYAYFKPLYINMVEILLFQRASISFTPPPVRVKEKRMADKTFHLFCNPSAPSPLKMCEEKVFKLRLFVLCCLVVRGDGAHMNNMCTLSCHQYRHRILFGTGTAFFLWIFSAAAELKRINTAAAAMAKLHLKFIWQVEWRKLGCN
jgi:hypothetical protein